MKSGYSMKTLKLDATYRPVEVVDCIEALVLCIVGKATAVEEYEEKISSPSITFKIPSVIVLKTIVKYFTNGFKPNRTNIIKNSYLANLPLTTSCQSQEVAKTLGIIWWLVAKNVIN